MEGVHALDPLLLVAASLMLSQDALLFAHDTDV
jgi:hypothetical protein